MDGKYLSSNIAPLKAIGNGRVLNTINSFIEDRNESRNEEGKGKLVAYEIYDSKSYITQVRCLIGNSHGLHYRSFEFYNNHSTVDDSLQCSAKYGFGFFDVDMEYFLNLRSWYLQNKEVPAKA